MKKSDIFSTIGIVIMAIGTGLVYHAGFVNRDELQGDINKTAEEELNAGSTICFEAPSGKRYKVSNEPMTDGEE